MGVYEDMACDAGYAYGTDENQQMAQSLQAQEKWDYEMAMEDQYIDEMEEEYRYYEILFRKFTITDNKTLDADSKMQGWSA